MTFFPPAPQLPDESETEPAPDPRYTVPFDVIPAVLPLSVLLARTENVAIVLVDARVYGSGVELRVQRKLRRGSLDRQGWQDISTRFAEYSYAGASASVPLQYGIELGDGTRIFDTRPHLAQDGAEPGAEELSLVRMGGGGSGGSREYTFDDGLWIWPLPPSEPIDLVLQWPVMGVPETRAMIDLTPVAGLAKQARPLW